MIVELHIKYFLKTDTCQVNGVPLAQYEDTGETIPLKGLAFAALERAKEEIAKFKPEAQPGIVVAKNGLPPIAGEKTTWPR